MDGFGPYLMGGSVLPSETGCRACHPYLMPFLRRVAPLGWAVAAPSRSPGPPKHPLLAICTGLTPGDMPTRDPSGQRAQALPA